MTRHNITPVGLTPGVDRVSVSHPSGFRMYLRFPFPPVKTGGYLKVHASGMITEYRLAITDTFSF